MWPIDIRYIIIFTKNTIFNSLQRNRISLIIFPFDYNSIFPMLLFIYFHLFIFFQNDRIKTIVILYTFFVLGCLFFFIFRQHFYISFPATTFYVWRNLQKWIYTKNNDNCLLYLRDKKIILWTKYVNIQVREVFFNCLATEEIVHRILLRIFLWKFIFISLKICWISELYFKKKIEVLFKEIKILKNYIRI